MVNQHLTTVTLLSSIMLMLHSSAVRHLYQGFNVKVFLKVLRDHKTKRDLSRISTSWSVWKLHLRVGQKEKTSLRCVLQWPWVTETRRCPAYQEGVREIKVLPFLTAFPCSGVTSPGVDNNGVILLSVAASLTLTDIFFFFPVAPVYHFFPALARAWMFFPLEFSSAVEITGVKMKAHTIAVGTMKMVA